MKNIFKRLFYIALFVVTVTFSFSEKVVAIGVTAGTAVTNVANMTYKIGGTNYGLASNTATFTVAELSGVTVTWQDAANVTVIEGATNQVLTFEITNIGNGSDSFDITISNTTGADDFDVTTTAVYLDTNGDGILDILNDTLYNFGVNDPILNSDQSIKIFILGDIPAAGLNDGDLSISSVNVDSVNAVGNYGDILVGAGEGGTDLVIGTQVGGVLDDGIYQAFLSNVVIDKTSTVLDPFGGANNYTGSVITYFLSVTVTGISTVTDLIITDPIPVGTTYVPNSLELNGASLTDLQDGDDGDVGGTTVDTVTVNLPDMDNVSVAEVISFKVTID